jgi:CelD/BcsL family acetyltransferase involved in cellulose biosynthesis
MVSMDTLPRPVCSVITAAARLDQVAPSWQGLLERSVVNEPVLSPLWLQNWWEVFGSRDGRQLRVCCFYREERLIGLAPLLVRRWWYRPGIPFRRLEALGTGERPHEAIHPDYVNILAERGAEQEVVHAFVEALVDGGVGGWDELVLPQMDGENPLLPLLTAAFRERRLTCDCQTTASASYIPLPAAWEEYLQQLPSSRRYFVRQSLRRFEQWAGEDACIHVVSDGHDLQKGKHILSQLHQRRWGEETGKFGSALFASFHERVLPALLQEGALELLWLTVRDEPIASLYNIVWNNKVYFYQSGRKPDAPSGQRPGIVLHAHAIRRAIASGRREYDFLGGGEHYKKQLALAARPLVQLRVVRPALREQLHKLAERGIGMASIARRRVNAAWRGKPPVRRGEPRRASESAAEDGA